MRNLIFGVKMIVSNRIDHKLLRSLIQLNGLN